MPSPFPGMDPYLEQHWGDIQTRLILYGCDQLTPQLPADLCARAQEHVRLQAEEGGNGIPLGGYYPDVKVTEQPGPTPGTTVASAVMVAEPLLVSLQAQPVDRSIHIIDTSSGNRVVTAIELLSPSNKVGEEGRESYRQKQRDLRRGGVNLVEIDLLRSGGYVITVAEESLPPAYRGPYRICVVRAQNRGVAEVYRVSLRERLPAIRIPLRPTDADAVLDLQPLIDQAYVNGRYHTIDYRINPVPALQGDDAVWAEALLREKGLRR